MNRPPASARCLAGALVTLTLLLGPAVLAGDDFTPAALELRVAPLLAKLAAAGFKERQQAVKDLTALATQVDAEVRQALAKPLDEPARAAAAPRLAAGRYLADRLETAHRDARDPELRASLAAILDQPRLPAAFYALTPRDQAIVLAPFKTSATVGAETTSARVHAAGVGIAVLDVGDVRLVRSDLGLAGDKDSEPRFGMNYWEFSGVRLQAQSNSSSSESFSGDGPAMKFEHSRSNGQCRLKWADLDLPIADGGLTFGQERAVFGRGPIVIFLTPAGTAERIIRLRGP